MLWFNKQNVSDISLLTKIEKIYPLESTEFKIHVPVLLITKKVVENIYNEKILDEIIKDEMKRDVLNSAWPEVNSIYDRFKKSDGRKNTQEF